MKRVTVLFLLLAVLATAFAQPADPRSLRLADVALEGPVDSLRTQLTAAGFTEWGGSADGEDYYFRGKFYGIRAKLIVSVSKETHLVTSAYITVGPYRTEAMLKKNFDYFLYKLQQENGSFHQRDGAYYYMDDFGSIKLSIADNDNGSHDIRVLYFPDGTFYKDAMTMGFHDKVQEVVTENAVAEEEFLRFAANGQLENPDLTDRQYNRFGYLMQARMTEQEGFSTVEYLYDDHYRLKTRKLVNQTAGISYIHEYTYNDQGEVVAQSQKVYDKDSECILTINLRNNFLTRDEHGNWTSNSLSLSYWEKGQQSQQTTVLQKRTIEYWE
ncbi:MAG: hypothetical protein IJ144_06255 [Prevotella sp.]|nr:hypothetical protein [Prevotella sp.]